MTKRTRRILFYSFILIFIILSSIIILVAFGYGYDSVHNRLVKTGALGVKSNISASVFINEQLEGQTSFLTNSFTKNRLIPGNYTVRLDQPDFRSWQKNVTIDAGFYTDFPDVNLIPETLKSEVVASDISATSQLLYGNWLVYFSQKGFLSYHDIRSELSQPARELDGTNGPIVNKKFQTILFDENKDLLFISSGAISYLLDPKNNSIRVLDKIPFPTNNSLYFRNNTLYGLIKDQLISYDLISGTSIILIKGVKTFVGSEDSLAYIDTLAKSLYIYSLSNAQLLGPLTPETSITSILQLISHENGNFVILQEKELPALFRISEGKLLKVSNYIDHAKLSPSKNRLLYYNKNEVSVLYINQTGKQPYREPGEIELITRTSQPIQQPTWYGDEEHILINIGGALMFIELDGRGNRNSYELTENFNMFAFYKNLDAVYTLSDGVILKMDLH